jgi:hypothetical protein
MIFRFQPLHSIEYRCIRFEVLRNAVGECGHGMNYTASARKRRSIDVRKMQ